LALYRQEVFLIFFHFFFAAVFCYNPRHKNEGKKRMALLLIYPWKIPLFIYIALCTVAIGAVAGAALNRPWTGGILSLVLGPLGWFVVLLFKRADGDAASKTTTPPATKPSSAPVRRAPVSTTPCPECGRAIRDSSLKRGNNTCPWCGSTFECA
jgi:hypothetical protein